MNWINKIKKYINKNRYYIIILIVLIGFTYGSKEVFAVDYIDTAGGAIGWAISIVVSMIAYIILHVVGVLNMLVFMVIISVAQYNSFIQVDTVIKGWVIIRDICNMFFVVILLVIAFGTILRIESYNAKKALPKLIIMAILINFSRTICGLIIDVSQVIMLTFVNGFAQYGYSQFVILFRVKDWVTWDEVKGTPERSATVSTLANSASIIAGVIAAIITLIVSVVILAILIMRIIMIWIYVILSPLAFITAAFPQGQKYSSQWWGDFSKQVIAGPILAFFLWLALATGTSTTDTAVNSLYAGKIPPEELESKVGASVLFTKPNFQKFIIMIGLLVGGLMVTQQLGGAVGSIAGKGMAAVQKTGNVGKSIGKAGMFKVGRTVDQWQTKLQEKVAHVAGMKEYYGKSLNYRMIKKGWDEDKAESMRSYEKEIHGSNTWHDTFKKYARVKQYMTLRKSRGKKTDDNELADAKEFQASMLQARIHNSQMTDAEEIKGKQAEFKKESTKDAMIKKYKKAGLTKEGAAEAEYDKDFAAIGNPGSVDAATKAKYETDRDALFKEANEYRDDRKGIMKSTKGPKWVQDWGKSTGVDPIYSRAGMQAVLDDEEKEMMTRTRGQDFAVINELIQAHAEKSSTKMAAAFNILAKNNDLNEALKDNRVISLMTKQNGILDQIHGSLDDEVKNKITSQEMKDDFRKNPVTPGYVQAMIQGMFKDSGVNDALAARYSHTIGSTSFASGNPVAYGMTRGDTASGNYAFNNFDVDIDEETGAKELVSSDGRIAGINGKFSNMESQQKMRTLHPDALIKEGPDGRATGISKEGREFLKTLTSHDLGQVNRQRLDMIRKIGTSPGALRDLNKLIKKLRKEGNENQAKIIECYTGYVISKNQGGGLKEEEEMLNAYHKMFGDGDDDEPDFSTA